MVVQGLLNLLFTHNQSCISTTTTTTNNNNNKCHSLTEAYPILNLACQLANHNQITPTMALLRRDDIGENVISDIQHLHTLGASKSNIQASYHGTISTAVMESTIVVWSYLGTGELRKDLHTTTVVHLTRLEALGDGADFQHAGLKVDFTQCRSFAEPHGFVGTDNDKIYTLTSVRLVRVFVQCCNSIEC
jgi:hypothetical protein